MKSYEKKADRVMNEMIDADHGDAFKRAVETLIADENREAGPVRHGSIDGVLRTAVGFWRNKPDSVLLDRTSHLPDPNELIREIPWDPELKAKILVFLRNPPGAEGYMGWSDCRICGCANGSHDFYDDDYVWPEGLGHYINVHEVDLPVGFVEHILEHVERRAPPDVPSIHDVTHVIGTRKTLRQIIDESKET